MIPPDGLSETLDWLFGGAWGFDRAADGAALGAVDPAVGSERQVVDDRMGIFEAKAFEVDHGGTVGFQIAVEVCIEKKVGRVQDPGTTIDRQDRSCDIQFIDEDVVGIVVSVLVFVFVDRDAVAACEPTEAWRFGDRVVDDPPMAILAENFEPFGIWVLSVLDDPQATLGIERGHQRLGDLRFAKEQLPGEPLR
jgi:hypothetical protein